MDMDQSAINQIIMDASSEEPGKKVDKLEKEIMILKGSIKKLIVDIREQMNNADNPFLNIQQLQMPAAPPVIKEDPIEFDMPKGHDDEEDLEEQEAKAEKKKKKPAKKAPVEEDEEDLEAEAEAAEREKAMKEREKALQERERQLLERERGDTETHFEGPSTSEVPEAAKGRAYSKRDMEMFNEFEEQKRMLEAMRNKSLAGGPATLTGSKKIDPYTMNQIMDWTRSMLRKNGNERMTDLLEMYVSTGYISEESKAIIQRMSKLMGSEPQRPPKRLDIKECVSDLYALYMILNPGDKDLDSRMLNVLLNPEERY